MDGVTVIDKAQGRQALLQEAAIFARLFRDSKKGRYRICRKGGAAVEWRVTGKYEIIEFVGEGSFGQVCRARLVSPSAPGSPETVVIKRIVDIFHVRIV